MTQWSHTVNNMAKVMQLCKKDAKTAVM